MTPTFFSINFSDPIWILTAFVFGFIAFRAHLPPLIGFLFAGFFLKYLNIEGGEFLNEMADLGITLLLFSIGLKLKVKELLKSEIYGVAIIHIVFVICLVSIVLLLLKPLGWPLLAELTLFQSLIIGLALSFSSTVFVAQTLEHRGDVLARYGKIAIGILIVQDLVAVVFLGVADAKLPSIWAIGLIILLFFNRKYLAKPLLFLSHGELFILYGFTLALGGAALFEAVDMKGDLGALVMGVMLANYHNADELSKRLLGFKELFLVGFFLSIGLVGLPQWDGFLIAMVLSLLVLVKAILFFFFLLWFNVRARPSVMAASSLANYSEFGLIVMAVAVHHNWLSSSWIVTTAVVVSFSFIISTFINKYIEAFYLRNKKKIERFQRKTITVNFAAHKAEPNKILVCGMGRVGEGAYDHLLEQHSDSILGLDIDENIASKQNALNRKAIVADISSPDFWSEFRSNQSKVEWILLCTPNLHSNIRASTLARQAGFTGKITSVSKYEEDNAELLKHGIDLVFNIYSEAGSGLARHALDKF